MLTKSWNWLAGSAMITKIEMNKKESKYFATAAKMDIALMELLEKKDFEYITVKEICERAGVNRSTFYLHYENTVDLLTETTRYVTNGFLNYFDHINQPITQPFDSKKLEQLIFITPEYIHPYLSYIRENRRVFLTALKHLDTMGFDGYYQRMFTRVFDPILDRFGVDANRRQYIMKFYLTGTTAIAVEWIHNGCCESVETISEIIMDCIGGMGKRNE